MKWFRSVKRPAGEIVLAVFFLAIAIAGTAIMDQSSTGNGHNPLLNMFPRWVLTLALVLIALLFLVRGIGGYLARKR
jgi:phosphatidylglycerophosphate synthase